ncbi:phosphopantetheine-binding protein [Allokutzneria sp. A3M-2-11 16]|uniref:phosphopantetheine-binding protein n=1 Tax=Allokutzneria sp. A3M-2-11 16 TaxID=2962043 RepID=UPI0020B7BF1B|nr:phosphopantetheine-binding protein [Allokutzneria sp. A3M-2-11 16]MCP3803357.1 phosphopantetheine-binding protein [Allokutzneria sp. A3M-2-11 16]
MTSDHAVRPRPRRTTATPTDSAPALAVPLHSGLSAIAGGRPVEELVVLTAAVARVLSLAERVDEVALTVRGPSGPVLCRIGLGGVDTVRDLVIATDQALRSGLPTEGVAGVVVSRDGVGAGGAHGDVDFALGTAVDSEARVLRGRVDAELFDPWFAELLSRSLVTTLAGFSEPRLPLVDVASGAPQDLDLARRFGTAASVLGDVAGAEQVAVVDAAGALVPPGFVGEVQYRVANGEPAGLSPRRSGPGTGWWSRGELAWWAPDGTLRPCGFSTGNGVAEPRSDTGRDALAVVVSVLSEALDQPVVRPDDNFFGLGGHSLLALASISELKKRLGVTVSLDRFLMAATVTEIAALIEGAVPADDTARTIAPSAGDAGLLGSLLRSAGSTGSASC